MIGTLLNVDYTNDETGKKSHPRLWFYNNERFFNVIDYSFKPYFYTVVPEPADEKTIDNTKNSIYNAVDTVRANVERQELLTLNERGKPKRFIRVVCLSTFDVVRVRDEVKRRGFDVREADILFNLRFLIDRGLEPMSRYEIVPGIEPTFTKLEGIDEPRVLALDIEAFNIAGFPQPKENPCIIITMCNGPNKENQFLLRATDDNNDKQLLQDFVDKFLELDSQIVVTYNGSQFDWPYLIERAKIHGVKLTLGIYGEEISMKEGYRGNSEVVIPGRTHVDLYQVAKRDLNEVAIKFGNLGLDNVAEFLGVMKKTERVNIEGSEIAEWWINRRDELLQYATDDAVSTWGIAKKLLPEQFSLSRLTHMPLGETAHANRGKMVEGYLMRASVLAHEVIGNKRQGSADEYQGALVKDPPRGLMEEILCLDIGSLYPSVMRAHNLGPDTLVDETYQGDVHVSPTTGHRFKKEPDGFFKKVLGDLIESRKAIRAQMKGLAKDDPQYTLLDSSQLARKVLTNSAFGYCSWSKARFYSKEVAESTTDWGRYYITQIIDMAEKKYGRVYASDTDSIFIKTPPNVEEFLDEVNTKFPVQLAIDKRFKALFFSGKKKRYSGLTSDDRIESKGIEVRRGDWCILAKTTQNQILDKILRERNPEAAAQAVKDTIKRLREGNYTRQEVTLWKSLTKDLDEYKVHQAHTKAIMKAMDENKGFKANVGNKVGYVMLKHEGQGTGKKVKYCPVVVSAKYVNQDDWLETIDGYEEEFDGTEGPEVKCGRPLVGKECPEHGEVVPKLSDGGKLVDFLEDDDEIDVGYYIEKQILKPSLRILSVFDTPKGVPYDEDYLMSRPTQMKLSLVDMYETEFG